MEKLAKTGHPPWARMMWYDAEAVYLEMPVKDSHPIIMKYPFTDAGLFKALQMMKKVYDSAGPHRDKNGWNLDHPIIKREREGAKPKPVLTTESRGVARAILRKLGMI
jgi:hypothetical protein